MTKQTHRLTARNLPVGEEGIERIRRIVEEKTYAKVNEVMVDVFSATAIIKVYDLVNDTNKERLRKQTVTRLADICLSFINSRQRP
jgi:hypothetical protein